MKFNYQKEIDSLRAFAVIPVILFHLDYNLAPNGYLGVDLFFVISGFVITKTLIKNKETYGGIEITSFFLRRLKRIYPALIFMVFISSIFVTFFGIINLNNYHLYLKTALFSIFGISNIFLIYKSDDYFLNQENNPFTHTWSLGVEEQFYLIYPFLLFLIFKITKNKGFNKLTYFVFSIISIISLYLFFFDSSIISNFYSPIIRFWELGLGCLAFFLFRENKNKISDLYIFIYIPILLIIYIFELKFISYQLKTFIIVFLTFLFLLRSQKKSHFTDSILKNKSAIYIGKISFSLYLWHLPIIYLINIYFVKEIFILLSILLSFIIAHYSYKFIETPIRGSSLIDDKVRKFVKLVPVLSASFILLIFVYGFNNSKNLLEKVVSSIYWESQNLNYVNKNFDLGNRVEPNYYLNGKDVSKFCSFDKEKFNEKNFEFNEVCSKILNNNKLFILNGDCHAQHFIPMIDNSSIIKNILFVGDGSLSTISKDCLVLNKCNIKERLKKRYHDVSIMKINEISRKFEEIILINKVFFTEKNDNMNLDNYYEVLSKYLEKFNKNIKFIFIEPTSVFEYGPASCVLLNKNCDINLNKGIEYQKKIKSIYNRISLEKNNVFVFNPNKFLCFDGNCKIYDKSKDFLYYKDNDNLSVEASKNLSKYFDKWVINHFYE